MEPLTVVAVLLVVTAVFSWINHRFIGLPVTIGVMLIALVVSLALILASPLHLGLAEAAAGLLAGVAFDRALLHGMLSFLLFAGALHIDLGELIEGKWAIGTLATAGVLVSVALVGAATWAVLGWVGIPLPWIDCLLFGALISPTDPIAVLGILKRAGVPRRLEIHIAGESLFNDGVAVVVFLALLELATEGGAVHLGHVASLFVQEALGGGLFGLGLGYLGFRMLRSVDNYQVEVLLTLALVMGGYTLATSLHLSGPIAIVVAGLLIGNHGRLLAMSETTRHHLDVFWELIDEILNAVLFVLIGLEVLVLTFTRPYLLASLLLIPAVLLSRLLSVAAPLGAFRLFSEPIPGAVRVLTWGGLRGGISVALALSLPPSPGRETIVAITYAVVVFSILVQGLTVGRLVKRVLPNPPA